MTESMRALFLGLAVLASLPGPVRTGVSITYPRISIFVGSQSSVTFTAALDGSYEFGVWFRDTSAKSVDDESDECCCRNVTMLKRLNESEKYSPDWSPRSDSSSLLIKNLTEQDDGVYCFGAADVVEKIAAIAPGYLKITKDDGAAFIPMVVILCCGGAWVLLLSAFLGWRAVTDHISMVNQEKLYEEQQRNSEQQHNSEWSTTRPSGESNYPLILEKETASYHATGVTNASFVSSSNQVAKRPESTPAEHSIREEASEVVIRKTSQATESSKSF